jgi:hypothetical protein
MCMACEMFWMEAEAPAPPPKRKSRKAAGANDSFACDAPESEAAAGRKSSKLRVRKARVPKTPKASAARA